MVSNLKDGLQFYILCIAWSYLEFEKHVCDDLAQFDSKHPTPILGGYGNQLCAIVFKF